MRLVQDVSLSRFRKNRVDPLYGSVRFLLHCDGIAGSQSVIDTGPFKRTMTVTGSCALVATKKFGETSLSNFGSSSRVTNSTALGMGQNQFCFECWMRWEGFNQGTNSPIISTTNTGGGNYFELRIVGNSLRLFLASIGTFSLYTLNTIEAAPNWTHVAVTRAAGDIFRVFVNGTQVGTTLGPYASYSLTNPTMQIGADTSSNYFRGFLDEIRLTNFNPRYTANFTPPTEPFPDC